MSSSLRTGTATGVSSVTMPTRGNSGGCGERSATNRPMASTIARLTCPIYPGVLLPVRLYKRPRDESGKPFSYIWKVCGRTAMQSPCPRRFVTGSRLHNLVQEGILACLEFVLRLRSRASDAEIYRVNAKSSINAPGSLRLMTLRCSYVLESKMKSRSSVSPTRFSPSIR